jgi:hypothetical protein
VLDNTLISLTIQVLLAGEVVAGISGTPIAAAFQPSAQGVNTQPTAYIYKVADRRYGSLRRSDCWQPVQSASFTGSISGAVLTVTAVASGKINIGDILSGTGITGNPTIASNGSGTGGTGTYNLSASFSVSSEAMTTATMTMVHTEEQQYETTFQLSALATQNPATPTQYTASDICNLCAAILQSSVAIQTFEANQVGIERVTDVRNPYFDDDRQQNEASPSFDYCLTHKQIIVSTTPVIQSTTIGLYEV